MNKQTFKNHIRFYTPHHFVYYPIVILLFIVSVYFAYNSKEKIIWSFISFIFVVLFYLAFMMRQHYALTLQNRIVKLELRLRYFSLTGDGSEFLESKLNDDQLFALRFAPDVELLKLIESTLSKNLSGVQIKKAIINWKGDYERV